MLVLHPQAAPANIDPQPAAAIITAMAEQPSTPLTVTELTARIKQIMEQSFASVMVSGEVSRLTRPASGHLYFTIKDAHAAISAVVWRSTAARLKSLPEEGAEFVFSGHLSVYEARGSYQLVVTRIEAAGAGQLAAEFEKRKLEYAARGWFDPAGKKPLPALPRHIGIVTSATAAAFEDVKKVLATRPSWLQITLAPCLVQGNTAAPTIARAIREISGMDNAPEVILLVRGGGSIEDLWCFNDEAVVRAIVDCPIPIISGIGHEIDITLADFAADVRAATPSNAAELCCPGRDELHKRIPRLATLKGLMHQRLAQAGQSHAALCQRRLHSWQRRMDARHHASAQATEQLRHQAHTAMQGFRFCLRSLEKRLAPLEPNRQLNQQRRQWSQVTGRLQQAMQLNLKRGRQAGRNFNTRLSQHAVSAVSTSRHALLPQARRFNRVMGELVPEQRQMFAATTGKLFGLDPTGVLKRGYSLAYARDGRLVASIAGLADGDGLDVHFHDGVAATRIESIREKSK